MGATAIIFCSYDVSYVTKFPAVPESATPDDSESLGSDGVGVI